MNHKKLFSVFLSMLVGCSIISGCKTGRADNNVENITGLPQSTPESTPAGDIVSDNRIIPLSENVQGKDYWKGKKIAFLGDSITELNGFQNHIERMLDVEVYSHGRSGTTIAGTNASFTVRATEIEDDADLIFVFGGTNDFHYDTPLGTKEDRASIATFYSSLRLLCKRLQANYPDALIVFITPLQRIMPADRGEFPMNGQNVEFVEYINAIIEICAEYKIPVLDLYNTSEITMETADQYLYDGLHPNATGFSVLANEMAAYLCPEEKFS